MQTKTTKSQSLPSNEMLIKTWLPLALRYHKSWWNRTLSHRTDFRLYHWIWVALVWNPFSPLCIFHLESDGNRRIHILNEQRKWESYKLVAWFVETKTNLFTCREKKLHWTLAKRCKLYRKRTEKFNESVSQT